MCTGAYGPDSALYTNGNTAYNTSETLANLVSCAGSWAQGDSIKVTELVVYVHDNSVQSFNCKWWGEDFSGNYYLSATKYTCSTPDGCYTDSEPSYNSLNLIYLNFRDALNSGNTIPNTLISMGAQCSIPGGGSSSIDGLATVVTTP